MMLEKLSFQNYRCWPELELDLSRQVTVLFGNNGRGKSSVVHGVAACLGGLPQSGPGPELNDADIRFTSRSVAGVLQREPERACTVALRLELAGAKYELIRNVLRTEPGTRKHETPSADAAFQAHLSKLVDDDGVLPLVAIYPARREWRDRSIEESSPGRFSGYVGARAAGTDLAGLRAWWRRANEIRQARPHPALNQIEDAIQRFIGEEAEPPFWDPEYQDVIVHIPQLEAWLQLRELSDGYRNMIALVADVARRGAELNPQLTEDLHQLTGFVAIDELDLHLHPAWQFNILPGLRRVFPNLQWLVTTHSGPILSTVESNDEAVFLDSAERGVLVSGRDVNQVLYEMGSNNAPPAWQKMISAVHDAIDSGDASADKLVEELADRFGESDPQTIRARSYLRRVQASRSDASS